MAVGEAGRVAAASVLLIASSLRPVSISRMVVPPLVNVSSGEGVLLDCEYEVSDGRGLRVSWLLAGDGGGGGGGEPVYDWSPPHAPVASGPLLGRVDTTFRVSDDPLKAHRALRIVRPSVLMSGQYTCRVSTHLDRAQQTRTMLVFSEEHDLRLTARALPGGREGDAAVEVSCSVRSVYPEPDLRLERFDSPIAKQSQKHWAEGGEGRLDATTTAVLPLAALRDRERFVCRLLLRRAAYEAKRELLFNTTLYQPAKSSPAGAAAPVDAGSARPGLVLALTAAAVAFLH